MKKIKMITAVMMCMLLVMGMTACGNTNTQAETSDTQQTEVESDKSTGSAEAVLSDEKANTESEDAAESEESETETQTASGKDTLVVVFSATGTTKGVAERIAAAEDADFYEIIAAETYTSDDLNYNDSNSRTTKEQDDKSVRPEIGSETFDLSGYSKIYIGYPIWWGEEPRIMDTFVESYDFGNIVMIPFCTSQSSGIGRSGSNLAENAGSGDWKDGDRLQSSISDADLQSWIDSYK